MTIYAKSKNGKFISTKEQIFAKHCVPIELEKCWEWQGYLNESGYGFTRIGGRGGKAWLAHRLSWEIHNGQIPDGLHVLHKCDNPKCVNPNHLFLGTNLDNILDRVKKGRSNPWIRNAPREKHPRTKILKHELDEMLSMRKQGIKVVEIAKKFNICKEHCSKITTLAIKGELSWYTAE
jgi:hypothetical protein